MKKFATMMAQSKNKVIGIVTAAQLALAGVSASAIEDVTVTKDASSDPFVKMGKMIGLLLTVTRYVGIALAIWGVYEFVMGITQDGQAEKKTKGIIWVFAGLLMALAKWILGPEVLGVIGN